DGHSRGQRRRRGAAQRRSRPAAHPAVGGPGDTRGPRIPDRNFFVGSTGSPRSPRRHARRPRLRVRNRVALALATAFGVGYVPIAPGTFGSPVGLVLWALLPATAGWQAVAIAAVFVAGSWSAGVAERHFARTDPSYVVIDEVLGMLMTLFLNPVKGPGASLGFLLFRIMDVVKPFPANRLERL